MEKLLLWLQQICLQHHRARPPQSPKGGSIQSGNEKAFVILCVLASLWRENVECKISNVKCKSVILEMKSSFSHVNNS
jgi:hypothetical protein